MFIELTEINHTKITLNINQITSIEEGTSGRPFCNICLGKSYYQVRETYKEVIKLLSSGTPTSKQLDLFKEEPNV